MEINASSRLLELVESLNDDLAKHRNEGKELTSLNRQELMREEIERIPNLEEGEEDPTTTNTRPPTIQGEERHQETSLEKERSDVVSEPEASMSMNESIDCLSQDLGLLPNPINRDTQHQERAEVEVSEPEASMSMNTNNNPEGGMKKRWRGQK